jgi:diguanylate cyclase (GGDEF)-like protein
VKIHGHAPEANLSYLDELTGLHNRRGFLRFGRDQLDAGAMARRPMLLIFVDLDGLKHINDQLGHSAGDRSAGGYRHRAEVDLPRARRRGPAGMVTSSSCW